MDSPNTKISRGNWSLVVVRKFIAENIISYRNRNEHPGILLTNLDFHLQTGNLGYKTGLSFTNGDSWVTNGILGLLFTICFFDIFISPFKWDVFVSLWDKYITPHCLCQSKLRQIHHFYFFGCPCVVGFCGLPAFWLPLFFNTISSAFTYQSTSAPV